MSDKDVLIVADNPSRRRQLTEKWSGDGWSVAAYSSRRLEGMARFGSLFIQHLKNEGLLISDERKWLQNLLDSAQPKHDYKTDFQSALQLIRPLERLRAGHWQNLMAADLAFVFIRNAGIYTLADRGLYEFSYDRIVEELAGEIGLSNFETDLLHGLRPLKVAYRAREQTPESAFDLDSLFDVCSKIAKVRVSQNVAKDAPIRLMPIRYATIRDAEARMIMQHDPFELDQHKQGCELSALWKMITAPRDYSWSIREIGPEWVAATNHLLSQNTEMTFARYIEHLPIHTSLS